jgi:hypothetical protein
MINSDFEKILQQNPQLDPERIDQLQAFQRRMEEAGVSFRTEYRIQPAMGDLASFALVMSNHSLGGRIR